MGDRLHALLATVAIGFCVVRTLDADERAGRFRPADGLSMFNWSRRGWAMGIEVRVAGASGRAAGAGVRRGATESDRDRPTVATTDWLWGTS